MSKSTVSSSYTDNAKSMYLDNAKIKKVKDILVLGYEEGNIGSAIAKHLSLEHNVSFKTMKELNVMIPDDFDLSAYDTIILNNGDTELNWIEDQHDDSIVRMIDNNLTGSIITTSKFVKDTLASGCIKNIIFIGSMAHNHVLNGSAPYCAAKAGLIHYAKCIAYELAPKGYRVFCVNPSNVQDAPMSLKTISELEKYRNLSNTEAKAYWAAECPMGNFLTMEEIASTVAFLLTESAKYLSGSNIDMAGGQR
jgi:NAD(P)-dependent dehydrogenase (short-subunit alcohol dehydrogenase family)